jgi:hypothetical protein
MTGRQQTRPTAVRRPSPRFRPGLETLERRDLPSFSSPVLYPVAPTWAMITADVNGDGKPDLITMAEGNGYVWLGNGQGAFEDYWAFADGSLPTAMAVGDLNGDGKLDIVLANGSSTYPTTPVYGNTGSVSVLLGNGQGSFQYLQPEYILPVNSISSLTLADVNGDGKPDLVAVNRNGNSVYVALNEGNGVFASAQSYSVQSLNLSSVPFELAVGDLNGDRHPDIAVSNPMRGCVSVLLNNGNGTFGTAKTYAVGGSPTSLALGDVSGDGKLDIVTANSKGTVSVLVNNGNGTFAAAQNYAVGGPASSVALGDFNHDGHIDIATTGSTDMDVFLNNGNGTFAAYQKVGPAGRTVVAADFNGDGFPDLAEIDASKTTLDVLLNNADW